MDYDLNIGTLAAHNLLEGIRCLGGFPFVCSNYVHDINTGFYFGDAPGGAASWVNNTMEYNTFGFVLKGSIGLQGAPLGGGSAKVTHNRWLPGTGFWGNVGTEDRWQTFTLETYLTGTDPTLSPMYVDGSTTAIADEEVPVHNSNESGDLLAIYGTGSIFTYTTSITSAECVALRDASVIPVYRPGSDGPQVVRCDKGPFTLRSDNYRDRDDKANATANAKVIAAEAGQHYTLSPNPTDGHIRLAQAVIDRGTVSVEIWNGVGERIYQDALHFENGTNDLMIVNAPPGVYLMQLTDAKEQRFILKFVIYDN